MAPRNIGTAQGYPHWGKPVLKSEREAPRRCVAIRRVVCARRAWHLPPLHSIDSPRHPRRTLGRAARTHRITRADGPSGTPEERSGTPQDPIVCVRPWAPMSSMRWQHLVDFTSGFGVAALVIALRKSSRRSSSRAASCCMPWATFSQRREDRIARKTGRFGPLETRRAWILGAHGADAIEAALKTAMLHTKRPACRLRGRLSRALAWTARTLRIPPASVRPSPRSSIRT